MIVIVKRLSVNIHRNELTGDDRFAIHVRIDPTFTIQRRLSIAIHFYEHLIVLQACFQSLQFPVSFVAFHKEPTALSTRTTIFKYLKSRSKLNHEFTFSYDDPFNWQKLTWNDTPLRATFSKLSQFPSIKSRMSISTT